MINIKNLNKFNRNDEGVSPVIGVILMVAATIVIAGVIMAMLGAFTPPEPPRTVDISATRINTTHIAVLLRGGPEGGMITNLTVLVEGRSTDINATGGVLPIGERRVISSGVTAGPNQVIIVARFADGLNQTVFNARI